MNANNLASATIGSRYISQEDQKSPEEPSTELFERIGLLRSPKISESSGLTYSVRNDGCFWTHNDSGHRAVLYCFSAKGETVAELPIHNAKNRDWEAMTSAVINSVPYLIVGEVGDNGKQHKNCRIYIVREPDLIREKSVTRLTGRHIDFTYEDGPHNCEAMAVDPITKEIWLIEKIYLDSNQNRPPGVYALRYPDSANVGPHIAERIGDFPVRNVTGMAFSPDGKFLIVRTYLNAHLYQRSGSKTWRETLVTKKPIPIPLPLQRQGEAICFTADSNSLIVTSELKRQPIWRINFHQYLAQISQQKSQPDNE